VANGCEETLVPGLSTRLLDPTGNPIGAATETPAAGDRGLVVRTVLEDRLPSVLVDGRLDQNVGGWFGSSAPTIGQKTKANSLPVTVASDQGSITVQPIDSLGNAVGSATTTPVSTDRGLVVRSLIEGRLPSALVNGRLDQNVGAWLGSTAPTVGQKTMANSLPVALASDQSSLATSVGSWIGSSAPTVGQKTMASSLPVAIASDQLALAMNLSQIYGRPEPPTYYARFDAIAPAANKYMACLWNGSSTHVVRVYRIWAFQDSETGVTTPTTNRQELRKITARTVGTTVTPMPLDDNDSLTSGIDASHNATGITEQGNGLIRKGYITTEEAKVTATAQALNSDTLGAIDWNGVDTHLFWSAGCHGMCKPIVLRKDKGIVMKNIAGAVGLITYVFEFTDEAA
jgi:hypothetical protein